MNNKIILLFTDWGYDYWYKDNKAKYPGKRYSDLPHWHEFRKSLPVAGLGIYSKFRKNDLYYLKFAYLKIKGLWYDSETEMPFFDVEYIEYIRKGRKSSRELYEKIKPFLISQNSLFNCVKGFDLLLSLLELGEKPPEEWTQLVIIKEAETPSNTEEPEEQMPTVSGGTVGDTSPNNLSNNIVNDYLSIEEAKEETPNNINEPEEQMPTASGGAVVNTSLNDWKNYIGKVYLLLMLEELSNDDFEDIVAQLLIALGFDVLQKGHLLFGAYPDGFARIDENFGIVYDCKNSRNFFATEEDIRAINQYYQDEKNKNEQMKIFKVFITKSSKAISRGDIFVWSVESLLYLLYKKLTLGNKFQLSPLKNILINNKGFSLSEIDNGWVV